MAKYNSKASNNASEKSHCTRRKIARHRAARRCLAPSSPLPTGEARARQRRERGTAPIFKPHFMHSNTTL